MSNPYHQSVHPQPPQYNSPPTETNGLGITGFVISLIGLFLCGIPSLIGLIISLFALGKQPKGFAIAGTILGGLGLLLLLASSLVMYSTYQAAQNLGMAFGALATEMQADEKAGTIGERWKESGELPSQAAGQDLIGADKDMFGNSFIYETDGTGFSIRSAGPDGVIDTEDDVLSGPFNDAQSAIDEANYDDEEGLDFEFDGLESLNEVDGSDNGSAPEADSF
jgi:hypothetical protein